MGKFIVKSSVGNIGEELGCRYLREKGYKIVETNYCNATGRRIGEIDIVAKKDGKLIFVEVKTRVVSGSLGVVPEESITRHKLRKLERIGQYYLRERKLGGQPYAYDALSILFDPESHSAKVRHLEGIFL